MRQVAPERVALLTPEQKTVYEQWVKDDKVFSDLMLQYFDALDKKDSQAMGALIAKVKEALPQICAHGRSTATTCFACDEIDRILSPELYDEEGYPLEET